MKMNPYDQIVLFGDSITQWANDTAAGFALQPALQATWERRLDVVNRGFSGYNTAHALHALPRFLSPAPPSAGSGRVRLLVVFFGANDACMPGSPSGQHVSLSDYRANLRAIVTHPAVVATHKPAVVLVTPPPVDEDLMAESGFGRGDRTAANTARYAAAAREVAAELCVACCDLWGAFMREATGGSDGGDRAPDEPLPGDSRAPPNDALRRLLSDGLHFRPAAYELAFKTLEETILRHYPELHPEKLPMVFPPWTEAPKA